jgi:hypothetical protein
LYRPQVLADGLDRKSEPPQSLNEHEARPVLNVGDRLPRNVIQVGVVQLNVVHDFRQGIELKALQRAVIEASNARKQIFVNVSVAAVFSVLHPNHVPDHRISQPFTLLIASSVTVRRHADGDDFDAANKASIRKYDLAFVINNGALKKRGLTDKFRGLQCRRQVVSQEFGAKHIGRGQRDGRGHVLTHHLYEEGDFAPRQGKRSRPDC